MMMLIPIKAVVGEHSSGITLNQANVCIRGQQQGGEDYVLHDAIPRAMAISQ
ncbi:MAG: hypothetical protein R3E93_05800 [Thiothrix sp.]